MRQYKENLGNLRHKDIAVALADFVVAPVRKLVDRRLIAGGVSGVQIGPCSTPSIRRTFSAQCQSSR